MLETLNWQDSFWKCAINVLINYMSIVISYIYWFLDTVAKINPTGFLVQFSSPYMAHRTDLSPMRRELHVLHRKWVKMQYSLSTLIFSHNIWIFLNLYHTNLYYK